MIKKKEGELNFLNIIEVTFNTFKYLFLDEDTDYDGEDDCNQ